MLDYTNAWRTMVNLSTVIAKSHENFQTRMVSEVILPLQSCHKEGEKLKRDVAASQKKSAKVLAEQQTNVQKRDAPENYTPARNTFVFQQCDRKKTQRNKHVFVVF